MTLAIEEAIDEDTYFKNGKPRQNRAERDHGRLPFGTRPFMVWDGEGYSVWEGDSAGNVVHRHKYCLYGNSDGVYVSGMDLGTREIFALMQREKEKNKQAIHVAFAFEYDVNMMLKDLRMHQLGILKRKGHVNVFGYRIEHRPKKWFQISWKIANGKRVAIRIYDIFTFFSTSLVTAIEKYVPGFEHLATVKKGKDRRSQFSYLELHTEIIPYWLLENQGTRDLIGTFRRTLYAAGINITSWHGPGAIATFLFTKHKVKDALDRPSDYRIEYASRCAYAGGRFELFRAGHYEEDIYSYDINSAYPYAISQLPNMRSGHWHHTDDPYEIRQLADSDHRIALVKLEFMPDAEMMMRAVKGFPMPLFHRAASGTVAYPVIAENWYHLTEARNVIGLDWTQLQEAWIYEDDGSYPFSWVQEFYEQRLQWKREGNPAEWAAKLGLNSLYGKMAQRIGWNEETGEPPAWHQLEWAGAITATCRSLLWPLLVEAGINKTLVSVETDGIYATGPLTKTITGIGDGLGQFKPTVYSGMTVIQSGMYWLKEGEQWLPPKSRGIPRERMDHDRALGALRRSFEPGVVHANHSSFVGYGAALNGRFDEWRQWKQQEREYAFGGDGKRFHNGEHCATCLSGVGLDGGLHSLCIGRIEGRDSVPHALPWREGDYGAPYIEEKQWGIAGS